MLYQLENDKLIVLISTRGAEIIEVFQKESEQQYIWNGDPRFWNRHAPILFPIVGSLNRKSYMYQCKEYKMSQHGFARDREFRVIHKERDRICLQLMSDKETRLSYPFDFILKVEYELQDNQVVVNWKVKNTSTVPMYFSIGAHPAFYCSKDKKKSYNYRIRLDRIGEIPYYKINQDGLKVDREYLLTSTKEGIVITKDFFRDGVYIFENQGIKEATLLYEDEKTYVTLLFNTPVFGIWAPKDAPFVCLEPWYGRCDKEGYEGSFSKREYGNILGPEKEYIKSYSIELG